MTSIIRTHSPQLTNHQVKIQHLDQTFTVEKHPKEAGTSKKWPQGANICHTLMGALRTIAPETPFQPTYSLRVAVEVYFWTYSKYSWVYLESPLSLILINSYFTFNLKHTKRQSQNIHSKHMQAYWFYFWLHYKALVNFLLIYILCLSIVLSCVHLLYLAIFDYI